MDLLTLILLTAIAETAVLLKSVELHEMAMG